MQNATFPMPALSKTYNYALLVASAFYNLYSRCMLQKADVPQSETMLYKYLGYEITQSLVEVMHYS